LWQVPARRIRHEHAEPRKRAASFLRAFHERVFQHCEVKRLHELSVRARELRELADDGFLYLRAELMPRGRTRELSRAGVSARASRRRHRQECT
jgi:hypothetical protein